MKRMLVILAITGLTMAAQADDALIALLGGSGRVVETAYGYRTDSAVITRTASGYTARLDDGRQILIRRTANGWRSQVVGDASSTRAYFHRR